MTTIAWDGKSVAADGMGVVGNYTVCLNYPKLRRVNGCVYAFTGHAPLFSALIKWHQDGFDPATVPCPSSEEFRGTLIVFETGQCTTFHQSLPYPDWFDAPMAWGAGDDFAIGAMKAGADAHRAIEIAIECNPETGGKIQVFDLSFQTQPKLVAAE